MATNTTGRYGQVRAQAISNIVPKDILRDVFAETLDSCADVLSHSYGPDGSTTEIRVNMGKEDVGRSQYTKDGNNILNHISFNKPIELSVIDDLKSITKDVVKEVGDGTTSAVILSDILFNEMVKKQKEAKENGTILSDKYMVSELNKCIKEITDLINKEGHECTLEDIYDIAFTSSDGNAEIAKTIQSLYRDYGMECYIDVGINNTKEDIVKTYEGYTLQSGYFNPVFINNRSDTTCTLHNAKIYIFEDPIDTDDMIAFFSKIVTDNIINPLRKIADEQRKGNVKTKVVPTVIVCPRIGADIRGAIDRTFSMMNSVPDEVKQLLIVTNILEIERLYDLAILSGAKTIKKYIDPKVRKEDEDKGLAPTMDTVHWFSGGAELVVADVATTKFINPDKMFNKDGSYSDVYNNLIKQLEAKLKNYREKNEELKNIYMLKRRIQSLKCNMVDYLIGGISYTDRDAKKDLVEDSVLNCRDAASKGVGYGANFEAIKAMSTIMKEVYEYTPSVETPIEEWIKFNDDKDKDFNPLFMLFKSYITLYKKIYEVKYSYDEKVLNQIVADSIKEGKPFNIRTYSYDEKVKTSIRSDIVILNAVSKIVELMFATNQYLLPSPALNTYVY